MERDTDLRAGERACQHAPVMAGELSDQRGDVARQRQLGGIVAQAPVCGGRRPSCSCVPKPTSHRAAGSALQMSEPTSMLERELDRRSEELIRRRLQGLPRSTRRRGRPPVQRRPTMSSARSGVCRNATRRRPSGRCRLRARAGGARQPAMAPRRSSTARAPPSTLRCGNPPRLSSTWPPAVRPCKAGACVPKASRRCRSGRAVPGRATVSWSSLVHATGATQ